MKKYLIKRNSEYKTFERFKTKNVIEKSFQSVSMAFDEIIKMVRLGYLLKENKDKLFKQLDLLLYISKCKVSQHC